MILLILPWKTRVPRNDRHGSTEHIEKQIAHGIKDPRLHDTCGIRHKTIREEFMELPYNAHEHRKRDKDESFIKKSCSAHIATPEKKITSECHKPRPTRKMHKLVERRNSRIPVRKKEYEMEGRYRKQRKSKPSGLLFLHV